LDYIGNELGGFTNLLSALDVNVDQGISHSSIQSRNNAFGDNYKAPQERTPFCDLVKETFKDFMLQILIVCAIVSLIVDMGLAKPEDRAHAWIEGAAILIAVAVVSLVSAWSDYQKEGQFLKQQMLEENSKIVTLLRDAKEEKIHKNYVKVGDIIKIENGMIIPVDGIVCNGVGVMSDESAMTGESDHLPKEVFDKCIMRKNDFENDPDNKADQRTPHDVPSPILLSGTQIQTGQGWFMCIVVGDMTCEG